MNRRGPRAVLAACLLGGCAALPALDGGTARDAAQTAELVRFLAAVARAEPGERGRVLARAAAGCERPAPEPACLRLGALYAQPEAGLRNDARARALLAPFAARARDGSAALAALLLAQVGERQRIEQQAAKNEEALRAQGEALRKRLEAISAVERDGIRREEQARERAGRAPAGRPFGG